MRGIQHTLWRRFQIVGPQYKLSVKSIRIYMYIRCFFFFLPKNILTYTSLSSKDVAVCQLNYFQFHESTKAKMLSCDLPTSFGKSVPYTKCCHELGTGRVYLRRYLISLAVGITYDC